MGQLMRHCPAAFVCHFCALSSLFPLFSCSPCRLRRVSCTFLLLLLFLIVRKKENQRKRPQGKTMRTIFPGQMDCVPQPVSLPQRAPLPVPILCKSSARSGACGRRSNGASERAREREGESERGRVSAAGRPADYHFDTPFMCGGLVSSPLPPGDAWATEWRTSARCERRER